eukprot:7780228-Ditylum_brightwellii.AAC.1
MPGAGTNPCAVSLVMITSVAHFTNIAMSKVGTKKKTLPTIVAVAPDWRRAIHSWAFWFTLFNSN